MAPARSPDAGVLTGGWCRERKKIRCRWERRNDPCAQQAACRQSASFALMILCVLRVLDVNQAQRGPLVPYRGRRYGASMSPVGILFLLFLLVPVIEIYFLIKVGNLIGAIPTIALVVFTALLGAMLLRFQGWVTLQRTRLTMARGELPAMEMLEGVLLLFAGALLLTPGFVTDAFGFGLLVPPLRQSLIRWFIKRSDIRFQQFGDFPPRHDGRHHTIEGEYRRDDD